MRHVIWIVNSGFATFWPWSLSCVTSGSKTLKTLSIEMTIQCSHQLWQRHELHVSHMSCQTEQFGPDVLLKRSFGSWPCQVESQKEGLEFWPGNHNCLPESSRFCSQLVVVCKILSHYKFEFKDACSYAFKSHSHKGELYRSKAWVSKSVPQKMWYYDYHGFNTRWGTTPYRSGLEPNLPIPPFKILSLRLISVCSVTCAWPDDENRTKKGSTCNKCCW